jgi:hypothetical protein
VMSVDGLMGSVVKACELLSLEDGFVPEGDVGRQLVGLTRSFVDEMGGVVSSLVEHNLRLEEMFGELVSAALGLASALEAAGGYVGLVDESVLWWEELGEPALEVWRGFRGLV